MKFIFWMKLKLTLLCLALASWSPIYAEQRSELDLFSECDSLEYFHSRDARPGDLPKDCTLWRAESIYMLCEDRVMQMLYFASLVHLRSDPSTYTDKEMKDILDSASCFRANAIVSRLDQVSEQPFIEDEMAGSRRAFYSVPAQSLAQPDKKMYYLTVVAILPIDQEL